MANLRVLSQTLIGDAVTIMPSEFNASQIKQAIRKLRFFIGACTHANIAELFSGVPTIFISYIVKAKGINKDLLGEMPDWRKRVDMAADEIKVRI